MSEMQFETLNDAAECGVEDLAAAALGPAGRPVRRKRVAFAMWAVALLAASAVIILGAAPLVSP